MWYKGGCGIIGGCGIWEGVVHVYGRVWYIGGCGGCGI